MTEWKTMDTAPDDGTWFLVLRAVTLIGAGKPPRAVPDLMIIHRTTITGEAPAPGGGYWYSSHGHSVADHYISGSLWAPLDALPLNDLYVSARGAGQTTYPLTDGIGDSWADQDSRLLRSIANQV
jgi:hypothetical protein